MSRVKSKQVTKSLKTVSDKEPKPRGRKGGRSPLPEDEKAELGYFYLPKWLLNAFKKLLPTATDRSKLVTQWVRAYVINNGESDRLLAQAPLSARLAAYLEATDAPQDLKDDLESLMVARDSDEVKITEGAVKVKGGSYIF